MKKIVYLFLIPILFTSMSYEGDVLQFSKFKIKDESGKNQIKVSKKGKILIGGKLMAIISKNGNITSKDGKVVASFSDEGTLEDANKKPLVSIDKNGKIDNGSGKYIYWSEEGFLMKGEENTGISISPVNKNSFQTASIIMYLYLSF